MQTYLVTGSAGFVGFHTSLALLNRGELVIGLDNFNDYYDPSLKEARTKILEKYPNYQLYRGDLADLSFVQKVLSEHKIDKVCHLAAQAGVRYSITHPHTYTHSNLVGFINLLEEAKNHDIKSFIYASSSSVYGSNEKIPYSITDNVDHPVSLYAATKKSNEVIAYSYHHLYGINCSGLRFFTVYGPYGRPDMAYFSFAKDIVAGNSIKVFNHGHHQRDFTYVDDIVSGVISALDKSYPYEIFNLGNNKPVELGYFIQIIEKELGIEAKKEYLPMQPGDVLATYADIDYTRKKLGYEPKTSIEEGLHKFISWYKDYYHIENNSIATDFTSHPLWFKTKQLVAQCKNVGEQIYPEFRSKLIGASLDMSLDITKYITNNKNRNYLDKTNLHLLEIKAMLNIIHDLFVLPEDTKQIINRQIIELENELNK